MSSDLQISDREYNSACFNCAKLYRANRAFGRRMRGLRETTNLGPWELADLMGVRLVDGNTIVDAEMGVVLYRPEWAKAALDVMRTKR